MPTLNSAFVDLTAGTQQAFFFGGLSFVPRFPTVANGAASVALEVQLPRNAVVRRFDLVVQATPAAGVALGTVAQVRPAPGTAEVVVDFRMLRTVSGFQAPEGFVVAQVFSWNGTAFGDRQVWPASGTGSALLASFSEIRTERLKVVLDRPAAASALETDALVVLPEAPADLELRIDGAAPAWTHPGPVVPGTGATPTDNAWTSDGKRIAHLGPALAALVGDPLGTDTATFQLVLSSRVPGVLALSGVSPDLSFIRRAQLAGSASRDVDFVEEGVAAMTLDLPPLASAARNVEEVRFTVAGEPPEERAVGPLEPFVPVDPDLPYPAELVADPDHAFCALLPSRRELAKLTAVRLPLVPGPSGAEARVVLWEGGEPEKAVDNGASEPLSLPASAPIGEPWVTFSFKKPVPLDPDRPLWAALVVSRGSAVWGLAASTVPGTDEEGIDEAPRAVADLRRGGPAGPWRSLPAALETLEPLEPDGLRARARAVGTPGKEPLPLLCIGLAGAPASTDVQVTPASRGTAAVLRLDPAVRADIPQLVLTSRAAVTVTLRDVDVVWRETPI
ncbi:MAG TPA: hypothetical protein VMW27_24720 [Thermoanaerobaculia bacterium]|nr:hypothetical protein [Thermoanaerobaculia bacterium]